MIDHSPECIAAYEESKREIEEYESKWPNYCRHCNGHGFTTWTENPPLGSEYYWPETLSELCYECAAHEPSKCPRCGGSWEDIADLEDFLDRWGNNDASECPHCGFRGTWNGGRPADYECWGCVREYEEDIPDADELGDLFNDYGKPDTE